MRNDHKTLPSILEVYFTTYLYVKGAQWLYKKVLQKKNFASSWIICHSFLRVCPLVSTTSFCKEKAMESKRCSLWDLLLSLHTFHLRPTPWWNFSIFLPSGAGSPSQPSPSPQNPSVPPAPRLPHLPRHPALPQPAQAVLEGSRSTEHISPSYNCWRFKKILKNSKFPSFCQMWSSPQDPNSIHGAKHVSKTKDPASLVNAKELLWPEVIYFLHHATTQIQNTTERY